MEDALAITGGHHFADPRYPWLQAAAQEGYFLFLHHGPFPPQTFHAEAADAIGEDAARAEGFEPTRRAVLDVLEREQLRDNAVTTGGYVMSGLRRLAEKAGR